MADLLNVEEVSLAYADATVLSGVRLSLAAGQVIALLGPNGSGKSTLLKVLLGHLTGTGNIRWQDRPLTDWRRRDLARLVAYLPQNPPWDADQTVADALRLGRAPYWGALGMESVEDEKIVRAAAASMNLSDLLHRRMDELSGGQRQRVLLGRCLAQEPKAMLLDEPDTFLDLKHQVELCRMLRELATKDGMGLLLASHDLNLAAMFADQVVILNQGKVAASGSPADVLRPEIIEPVYGVRMDRIERPGATAVLIPRMEAR
jgi:iron complex transport system ATP-binding protein